MITVKDRLIAYLKYRRIGQNKFESLAGIANGYISKLKTSPSIDILMRILNAAPDLNRDWLLTGTGDMLADPDPAPASPEAAARIAQLEAEVQSLRAQLLDKAEEIIALQRQLLRRQQ